MKVDRHALVSNALNALSMLAQVDTMHMAVRIGLAQPA
jgi:hypothetical protein